jgi:hypothetical protein
LNQIKYDPESFINEFLEDVLPDFLTYFQKYGFSQTSSGRNRIALLNAKRNIVIKLPLNQFGIDDIYWEFKNQGEQYAKNKIFVLPKSGIPLLVMEKITETDLKEKPDWAQSIDSGQVGRNKKGIFKAYDYGLH